MKLSLRLISGGGYLRLAICLGLLAALVLSTLAAADTVITKSYQSDESLALGSIVSLRNNTDDSVTAATIENVNNIFGIVVNDNESPLSISNGADQQILIATDGVINVLVSDLNGDIKQGDPITASSISGIGMKATRNVKIVGIAQGDLLEGRGQTRNIEIEGEGSREVVIGEVPVLVEVSSFFVEPEKTIIPSALQNIANTIAGREIRPLPIIISAGIFVVTLIAVASILFSMIRGSIISVGRNPMSQSAVYRNVIQMSVLVVGILGVSVVAIYLVLTKL